MDKETKTLDRTIVAKLVNKDNQIVGEITLSDMEYFSKERTKTGEWKVITAEQRLLRRISCPASSFYPRPLDDFISTDDGFVRLSEVRRIQKEIKNK